MARVSERMGREQRDRSKQQRGEAVRSQETSDWQHFQKQPKQKRRRQKQTAGAGVADKPRANRLWNLYPANRNSR